MEKTKKTLWLKLNRRVPDLTLKLIFMGVVVIPPMHYIAKVIRIVWSFAFI